MPNTFTTLDVPINDGSGVPFVTRALGRPKTIVFSGPVLGRYIVEGSNDGGNNWDILVDDSGQQALFTSPGAGRPHLRLHRRPRARAQRRQRLARRAADDRARRAAGRRHAGVRRPGHAGRARASARRSISALSAGAFKTFILRGAIPPGSRYTILGSIDGVRFDEVMLFTSDQQGARPIEFFCRFLRVQRAAGGPTPVLAFGMRRNPRAHHGADRGLDRRRRARWRPARSSAEEVLRQYRVPLALLAPASLRVALAGEGRGPAAARNVTFRVRTGGAPDQPDGTALLTVQDVGPGDAVVSADSPAFARPTDPVDPHQAHRPGRRRRRRRPSATSSSSSTRTPADPILTPNPEGAHHGQRRCPERARPERLPHLEPRDPDRRRRRHQDRQHDRPAGQRHRRLRRDRACSPRPPTTSTPIASNH